MVEVRQLSSEGLETGRPLTRKLRVAWLWICLQCLQVGAGGHEACCFPLAVWQPTVHTHPQPVLPLTASSGPPLLPGPVSPHGFPLSLQTALPSCTLSPTSTQRAPSHTSNPRAPSVQNSTSPSLLGILS